MQLGQVSPRHRAMSGLVCVVTIVLPKKSSFCFVWTVALFCVPRANRPAHTVLESVSFIFTVICSFVCDWQQFWFWWTCLCFVRFGMWSEIGVISVLCVVWAAVLSCMSRVNRPAHLSYLWDGVYSVLCFYLFCQYFEPNTRPGYDFGSENSQTWHWWAVIHTLSVRVTDGNWIDGFRVCFNDGENGGCCSTVECGVGRSCQADDIDLVDCLDEDAIRWSGQWQASYPRWVLQSLRA